MENTQKLLPSLTKWFFPLSILKIDMTDHCLMHESLKDHANSIKTGLKAVSIDRMPKHVDEKNLYIGYFITK